MNAPHSIRPDFEPGRLRSLWDMLEFKAAPFIKIVNALASIRVLIEQQGMPEIRQDASGWLLRNLKELHDSALSLDLTGAPIAIERLIKIIEHTDKPADSGSFRDGLLEIQNRIIDELDSVVMLAIQPSKREFWEQKTPPFGGEVDQKFSSFALYEITEAAKCLAVDRSTASTFHSIRCLESGIRAMSRCLQIPDPTKAHERSWKKMLDKIKAAIDARWPSNSHRLSGDGEFFDNAYAALAAMQNPYRNATMHLDQKYTSEEARHIFEVVGGFMKKLSSRMDEDGLPLA